MIPFQFLAALFFVIYGSPAHASQESAKQVAIEAVVAEIAGHVQPLARDFYVFSYAYAPGRKDAESRTASGYAPVVRATIDSFFEMDQSRFQDDDFGGGLYAALDPLATQYFGKLEDNMDTPISDHPHFELRVFPLSARMQSLDLEYENKRLFVASTSEKLANAGCAGEFAASLSRLISPKPNAKNALPPPVCREIALGALRNAGVQVLFYQYEAYPLDGCLGRSQKSVILIDPTFAEVGNFEVLFPEIPQPDSLSEERRQIERVARYFSGKDEMYGYPSSEFYSLWPSLLLSENNPDRGWMKQHLFNCQ
jgi:hypothetical protein